MAKHSASGRMVRYTAAILVPVMLMTAVFFMLTASSMVRLATENMQQQALDSADKMNRYLQNIVDSVADVRELIEINCSTDDEVVEFVRSTEHYGVYGGVYTGDNTGFYVGSTPWDIPDDYDPTTRPWYIDGKDSRDFVYGEPYLDASVGSMTVSVSARMDAGDDSIVRVIAADVYLDYMDELAKDLVSGDALEGALIVTGEGMIVADSTGEHAGEALAESSEFNAVVDQIFSDKISGLYKFHDGLKNYYGVIEEIPVPGWYLVVYEARADVLHSLYVTEIIMAVMAIAVSAWLVYVMKCYGKEVSEVEQQANKAKTEFISRISHDIRTPIGQVLNLTEFAKKDKNNPEKLEEDLDRIDSSGKFLLSLINDVLDVSQIESGRMELHNEVSTYSDYMNDIRNLMIPLCESRGLTCTFEGTENEADLPDMYCDVVRLKQVTLNLISNAVKYTNEGSVTYISETTAREDGGLSFGYTIRDTGVGMSKEFMEHMFDKFTRDTKNELRDSTQMGSGLGLYLVKNMITIMGGTIEYQSEKGKGTSVTVRLDMDKAPEAAAKTENTAAKSASKASSKAAAPAPGTAEADVKSNPALSEEGAVLSEGGTPDRAISPESGLPQYHGKVLLAEDNEINTEIALRLLEEMGLTVECAANGEEALEKFKASPEGEFDLIFMDLQMPKMNGYEATRQIRALDRTDASSIPVVAMTADAFTNAMEESKNSGMNGFITKPLMINQICEVLEKAGL